ncbi:GIY-YIG nuclease family protein [Massilia sp. UBA6681]|uniref:GIY-YIG nuclease family protein n=1 Tax=Massilia sp. UBA6681 TaxID=1946839 RepID=UPI0025C2064D|nr:GIY-YIG nuclease family protein [Massilia sp. UBA6681]
MKTIAVLQQRGEPVTYRELIDLLWEAHSDLKQHLVQLYQSEQKARKEMRIRLGTLVKEYPDVFSAAMSDGFVLVGLSAGPDELDDTDLDEADLAGDEGKPAVYWYTFPAYQSANSSFPIKIGRGIDPLARIKAQVTAMPEQPTILGTYEHHDPISLERALHSVLILRGKRKTDAPGAEWFMTTPDEISALIRMVLG